MHRGRGGYIQSLLKAQRAKAENVTQEVQLQSHDKSHTREVPGQQISDGKEGLWQESPEKWAKSIWDESPIKQGSWQESPRKQDACQVLHSKEGTHPISQDVWRDLPSQQNKCRASPIHHSTGQQFCPQGQQQNLKNQQDKLLNNNNNLKSADMNMSKQFEDAGKLFASMTVSANSRQGQTQNPSANKATSGMVDGSKQGQGGRKDLPASTTAFDKVPVNPAAQGTEAKQNTACICSRPKKRVWCKNCGSMIMGRINIVCQEHIQVMYLSDHRNCWSCRAPLEYLMELDDDVVLPKAKPKDSPLRKNRVANRQE